MVRMADIIKKAKQQHQAKADKEKVPAKSSKQKPQSSNFVKPGKHKAEKGVTSNASDDQIRDQQGVKKEEGSEVRISKPVMETSKLLDKKDSLRLYRDTQRLIEDIHFNVTSNKNISNDVEPFMSYVEKFVNQQMLGNENILELINLTADIVEDYIHSHVLNVCIICIDIGIGLGYDKARLAELGLIALLHDIGLVKFSNLYKKHSKLSPSEFEQIKGHSAEGYDILKDCSAIYAKIMTCVYQVHERIDGSGYPTGLKGDAIDEYARIVGVADVYEAMTHARPYRNRMHPCEVLKELIKIKEVFDKKALKGLIGRVSCPYPIGTTVLLNTGERGRVMSRNLGTPFNPVVEIIFDAKGKRYKKPRLIDLSKTSTIHIKEYIKSQ